MSDQNPDKSCLHCHRFFLTISPDCPCCGTSYEIDALEPEDNS